MSNKTYSKLVKKLDRQLTTGRISRIEWRDARWKLLQVARPTTRVRVTGL